MSEQHSKLRKHLLVIPISVLLLAWLVCGLAIYVRGNFAGEWRGVFLLANRPLLSVAGLLILGIALLTIYGLWSFLVGLWGPVIVAGVVAILSIPGIVKLQDFVEYPWRIIFTVGILASLWAQLSAAFYFRLRNLSTSTDFKSPVLDTANEIVKFVMVVCVLVALIGMVRFGFHILFSLGYLALVAVWDFTIVRWSKPVNGKQQEYDKYRKCCGELLWHVDGVVFLIVFIWLVVIQVFVASDSRLFSFVSEVSDFLIRFPEHAITHLVELNKHRLEEPLMGGVIGFHSILSMALLVAHFRDWESERTDSRPALQRAEPAVRQT
jgi:hypothetical protein